MICCNLPTIALLAAVVGQPGTAPESKDTQSEQAVIGRQSTAAPPAAPNTAGTQPEDDQARLKFLAERFAEYHLFRDVDRSTPLKSTAEPVLRYSNPVRAIGLSDGVVYLWLHGARPVAAASLSIRQGGELYRELTFLERGPLTCIVEDATIWSPAEGGQTWAALSAAEPAASKSLRLVQMRSIARRFAATYYKPDTQETFELRVLSQPVYRYEDEASGTVDGAVFVFAESNDPETLLLLEAVTGEAGGRSWRYGLARMSSVRMTVRLDDREVWSVENYWSGPRSPGDPYLEARDGRFWADAEEPK